MICKECGKELDEGSRASMCNKCKVRLYYAHSEIRFDMWEFMKHHGAKVKELYEMMCKEEGAEWVDKVLGDKLVQEIRAL